MIPLFCFFPSLAAKQKKKETALAVSLRPSKKWQSHFFEGGITLRFVPCRPQGGCDTRGARGVNRHAPVAAIYNLNFFRVCGRGILRSILS